MRVFLIAAAAMLPVVSFAQPSAPVVTRNRAVNESSTWENGSVIVTSSSYSPGSTFAIR